MECIVGLWEKNKENGTHWKFLKDQTMWYGSTNRVALTPSSFKVCVCYHLPSHLRYGNRKFQKQWTKMLGINYTKHFGVSWVSCMSVCKYIEQQTLLKVKTFIVASRKQCQNQQWTKILSYHKIVISCQNSVIVTGMCVKRILGVCTLMNKARLLVPQCK